MGTVTNFDVDVDTTMLKLAGAMPVVRVTVKVLPPVEVTVMPVTPLG